MAKLCLPIFLIDINRFSGAIMLYGIPALKVKER
jgi:hypothetical protein